MLILRLSFIGGACVHWLFLFLIMFRKKQLILDYSCRPFKCHETFSFDLLYSSVLLSAPSPVPDTQQVSYSPEQDAKYGLE